MSIIETTSTTTAAAAVVRTTEEAMRLIGMDPASQQGRGLTGVDAEIVDMARGYVYDVHHNNSVTSALLIRLIRRSERVQRLLAEVQQLKLDRDISRAGERKQREGVVSLTAELAAQKAASDRYKQRIESLVDEIERLDPLQRVTKKQAAELERLRPLAAKEQARLDKIAGRRSKAAKAAAKKRAAARQKKLRVKLEILMAEAQASDEMPKSVHKALAKRLGVTAAYSIVWVDGRTKPYAVYEASYHTTMSGGTVVHSPNSYGYPTQYHCAVRQIHVGKAWYRRNLRSLCREALGL